MTPTLPAYRSTSDFLDDPDMKPIAKGIGGSDIATIVGMNKHESVWDVWAKLTGRKERFQGNVATTTGTELEPWVADVYRKKHNVSLVGPIAPLIEGYVRRSPDRLILEKNAILEVKTSLSYGARNIWGDESEGVEAVPDMYNCQVRWYMASPYDLRAVNTYDDFLALESHALIHGPTWTPEYTDIAVFMTGPEHRYYRIHHDQEISDTLLEEADKFWRHHVLKDIEPPPDGSKAAAKHLTERFKETTEHIKKPDATTQKLIDEYRKLSLLNKRIEKAMAKRKQNIQLCIGEDRGLGGSFGKITWYTQARKSFSKDTLYQSLMKHVPRETLDHLFSAANTVNETRIFRTSWSDKNDPTPQEISSCLD